LPADHKHIVLHNSFFPACRGAKRRGNKLATYNLAPYREQR